MVDAEYPQPQRQKRHHADDFDAQADEITCQQPFGRLQDVFGLVDESVGNEQEQHVLEQFFIFEKEKGDEHNAERPHADRGQETGRIRDNGAHVDHLHQLLDVVRDIGFQLRLGNLDALAGQPGTQLLETHVSVARELCVIHRDQRLSLLDKHREDEPADTDKKAENHQKRDNASQRERQFETPVKPLHERPAYHRNDERHDDVNDQIRQVIEYESQDRQRDDETDNRSFIELHNLYF